MDLCYVRRREGYVQMAGLGLNDTTTSSYQLLNHTKSPIPSLHQFSPMPTTNNTHPVFKQPLALHSTSPMTGYMRTGYCTAPSSDFGNHSVAGIVTTEFLDFSAARGNDLRSVGLSDGCKWCLCVSRWKEAFDARTGPEDRKVPRVVLKATSERALEKVGMEELRGFAVDKE